MISAASPFVSTLTLSVYTTNRMSLILSLDGSALPIMVLPLRITPADVSPMVSAFLQVYPIDVYLPLAYPGSTFS